MRQYRGRGLGDFYLPMLKDLTEVGEEIVVREKSCTEFVDPVVLEYTQAGYCWMNIPKRRFNVFFALAEVVWILKGMGDIEWISYFNSNMRTFADPGRIDFHGAYGQRMRRWHSIEYGCFVDQIHHAIHKLKKDPYSRQAVISLWDPVKDNLIKSKDLPCNNLVYYRLRKGYLHQTVVIRSNDMVWGTPVNAIQFTHLHALVAGELGAKMGKMTYFVQNMHYYLDEYKTTLSDLIKNSFSDVGGMESQTCELFGPVTFDVLDECWNWVDFILQRRNTGEPVLPDDKNFDAWITTRDIVGHEYWTYVIPRMIWIYVSLKEGWCNALNVVEYAKHLSKLPAPFPRLAIEFLSQSKKIVSQKLAEATDTLMSLEATQ